MELTNSAHAGQPSCATTASMDEERHAVKPSTLLSASERRKQRTPKTMNAATSREQVRAVMQVGERLRMAREMNGWEVSEAARRLGFENPGSLSRLELAKHVSAIPLYIIPRAAQVYGTTTDFLHGLTDDLSMMPNLRLRRDVALWLADEMERSRQRDINAMLLLQEQIEIVFLGTREVVLAVEELCDSVSYMRNKSVFKFENMPGSSAVLSRTERAMSLATSTSARLARLSAMVRSSRVKTHTPVPLNQMPLDFSK